jgi:hypothetical protein
LPTLLGMIGVLVTCAGLDLLWQTRTEIQFWISAYVKMFRAILKNRDSAKGIFSTEDASATHRGAVRFLLGFAFAFVFGPALIVIGVGLFLKFHL